MEEGKLIPEEWFIKKSAFTGQETYFPKEKILDRINKIINMKDDISLDDLAQKLSCKPVNVNGDINQLIEENIVSQQAADMYFERYGENNTVSFEEMLNVYIFNYLLNQNNISIQEIYSILDHLKKHYEDIKGKNYEIVYLRKMGVGMSFIVSASEPWYPLEDIKVIEKIKIIDFIQELKEKII